MRRYHSDRDVIYQLEQVNLSSRSICPRMPRFTSSFSTEKCLEYQVSPTQEDDCWFLFLNRGGNSSRKDADISQLSVALMERVEGKDAKMAKFKPKEKCFSLKCKNERVFGF
ncbi:hypothetical protein NPIL_91591 [Nephila pilipes]|uniref:Uncharacterized protein n=1 Tax=Nephila pilipes TaxID=299642 RepID=A0A8X6TQN2_NEPPI|nr:hypothetical protein NPIL_91591 [Nephila pilipes]